MGLAYPTLHWWRTTAELAEYIASLPTYEAQYRRVTEHGFTGVKQIR
ncbi:MAG: hypothetical protein Q8K58_15835 [Acidimicrobiales bacterium]|nr:hypothetical protein [Acidimicrobiales bacterium]